MIMTLVDRWNANKETVRKAFQKSFPDDYTEIVRIVIDAITTDDYRGTPDPERIHVIDDGNYQGTLLFVIAEKGYQPDCYYYVKVGYGSCSGCDTLESIRSQGDWVSPPNEKQVDGLMVLALHIVQGIKKMDEEYV